MDEELTKLDLYEFLEIDVTADDGDIKRAYRKKALQYHPDKNPDNPKAAKLFLQYQKAHLILLDKDARKAYDSVLHARKAALIRKQKLDGKRRKLKEDLELREQAALNKRQSEEDKEKQLLKELERLKKEGKKLIEEEQERLRKKAQEIYEKSHFLTLPKIKVKWRADKNDVENGGYSQQLLEKYFGKYGSISAIVFASKRKGTALIEFKDDLAAIQAFENEKGLLTNPLTCTWVQRPFYTIPKPSTPLNFDEYEAEVLSSLSKIQRKKNTKDDSQTINSMKDIEQKNTSNDNEKNSFENIFSSKWDNI